ncbi:hypothetical protein [Microbacterium sp. 22296]|uniref:hypothetical protein n=1 Tax=Microbacterium sp. 22296 TaxID=3453903 RepID=UPI003F8736C6
MPHPFDALPKRLWDASASSARYAVSHYADADDQVLIRAALSLGHAAEQLIMACLATIDTALLADGKIATSRYALSKGNATGALNIHTLRTTTWGEGYSVLRQVDPKLGEPHDIKFVMETRNAAAHIAMVDSADLAEAVVKLAHTVGLLHGLLPGFVEDDYWGPTHLPVVTGLRDARADKVKLELDAKLLAATEYSASLFPAMSEADRETVLITMEARKPTRTVSGRDGDVWERHPCPACNRSGYLHYALEHQDDHEEIPEYDSDGHVEGVYVEVSVEWIPLAFECPVCNLDLDEDEVVLVDGIDAFIAEDKVVLDRDEMRAYYGYDEACEFERWR